MLAPTPPQLCLLFFLKQEWRHLDICWNFRWFLLPSVMDPSLYYGFSFQTNQQQHNSRVSLSYQSRWVAWILFSFRFPTLLHNKALRGGFIVCNHHKCFIPSMHRLCCSKERLLYSVPSPVCAISLMNFMFTSLLPFSSDFPLRLAGRMQHPCINCLIWMKGCEMVWVCAQLFYFNLHKLRVLVRSGACG